MIKQKEHPESKEARDAMLHMRTEIGEHFEAGFIITTKEIDGQTHYYHASVGNKFAIKGVLENYMEKHYYGEEE
jgi:hypothetical protein